MEYIINNLYVLKYLDLKVLCKLLKINKNKLVFQIVDSRGSIYNNKKLNRDISKKTYIREYTNSKKVIDIEYEIKGDYYTYYCEYCCCIHKYIQEGSNECHCDYMEYSPYKYGINLIEKERSFSNRKDQLLYEFKKYTQKHYQNKYYYQYIKDLIDGKLCDTYFKNKLDISYNDIEYIKKNFGDENIGASNGGITAAIKAWIKFTN
tara:strand:- start:1979 stop:2596 length:618 start_codon:yes stop_codon:yes gene_type:complete